MPVKPLNIFSHFDVQRFDQFGAMDAANWYLVQGKRTKEPMAMYPAMGRKHVQLLGENKLVFDKEPDQVFRSINFMYAVIGTQVIQVDQYFNQNRLGTIPIGVTAWFDYIVVGNITYCLLTAETKMYVITENGTSSTFQEVTDNSAPENPQYVAAFGDRFVVNNKGTPDFYLSQINLDGTFDPNTAFTINGASLVARASGIIKQFAVLHNQLYIFTDFITEIWANIPTQITVSGDTEEFPWKKNTSYNFNVGIAEPFSLKVGFEKMAWLCQNRNGFVSFVVSEGNMPQEISTEAVDVLLENSRALDEDEKSAFLVGPTNAILYQWENTVFYRVSAGQYKGLQSVDRDLNAHSLEFNFNTSTWHRVTELNGERNRIEKQVFFAGKNLVTVQEDPAMYEMSGNIYRNEIRDTSVSFQNDDAFKKFPMRYVCETEQIFNEDYAEFITDYLEIDFVFGHKTFHKSDAPFDNTTFIVSEDQEDGEDVFHITEDQEDGEDVFIITEDGNTPTFDDSHYNTLFKPHVSLYWSDDGGVTYHSADVREFSPLGNYRWRMRWYELGPSRNRRYKLVCVSSAPIVILGAVHNYRRASGGNN